MQLADLIINYDKDEVSFKKTKVGGKLYKVNKKKISNLMETVDEREELKEGDDDYDDLDSS